MKYPRSPNWAWAAILGALFSMRVGVYGAEDVTLEAGRASRMDSARNEVANVRSNIFITLVQLDKVRGEREWAGPQYQAFTNQLVRMEELARALGKRAEEMRQKGNAYFSEWEIKLATMKDPVQRQQAQGQTAQRRKSYDSINRSMQEARRNFTPFVAELRAIKGLLEGPRDGQSIAQAKDLFMRANWHCIDVQRSLMEMEAEFETLAATFSSKP